MLQNDSRTRLKISLVVRPPTCVLCVLASEWPGEGTGNTWKYLRLAVMEKGSGCSGKVLHRGLARAKALRLQRLLEADPGAGQHSAAGSPWL